MQGSTCKSEVNFEVRQKVPSGGVWALARWNNINVGLGAVCSCFSQPSIAAFVDWVWVVAGFIRLGPSFIVCHSKYNFRFSLLTSDIFLQVAMSVYIAFSDISFLGTARERGAEGQCCYCRAPDIMKAEVFLPLPLRVVEDITKLSFFPVVWSISSDPVPSCIARRRTCKIDCSSVPSSSFTPICPYYWRPTNVSSLSIVQCGVKRMRMGRRIACSVKKVWGLLGMQFTKAGWTLRQY